MNIALNLGNMCVYNIMLNFFTHSNIFVLVRKLRISMCMCKCVEWMYFFVMNFVWLSLIIIISHLHSIRSVKWCLLLCGLCLMCAWVYFICKFGCLLFLLSVLMYVGGNFIACSPATPKCLLIQWFFFTFIWHFDIVDTMTKPNCFALFVVAVYIFWW